MNHYAGKKDGSDDYWAKWVVWHPDFKVAQQQSLGNTRVVGLRLIKQMLARRDAALREQDGNQAQPGGASARGVGPDDLSYWGAP